MQAARLSIAGLFLSAAAQAQMPTESTFNAIANGCRRSFTEDRTSSPLTTYDEGICTGLV